MSKLKALLSFIENCPSEWSTCPIYKEGTTLPNGDAATGKVPHFEASKAGAKWSPSRSALCIEQNPDTFQAFGVFTGVKSAGLCIFDVDYNLGAIQKKWGKDLTGPKVTSNKKNAAKYLFIVPEEDRLHVRDISHTAADKEGYEVLWGRQGVLFGAYGGHAPTKTPPGEYKFEGDINQIPIAPTWLLERMREQYRKDNEDRPKKRLKDTRWSARTKEEKIVIAENCLSVIPPKGAYSEDYWWQVGAMINSELPGKEGLKVWEDWSKRDPEYSWDWSAEGLRTKGNPCEKKWNRNWKHTGNIRGFGSLIAEADEIDPTRSRFQRDDIASLVDEIEKQPQKVKFEYLNGEELIARGLDLEEEIEDPALLDQAKTVLAMEAGRSREGAVAIDRLIDAHLSYKRNAGGKPKDVADLDDTAFEYLIPGLLPKPWLLLIHADGGTGKSAMCQTLCKHISQGRNFNVHGGLIDIERGKCLWLNGDQSERITRRQFNLIGVDRGVDVVGEWDMAWYRKFCKIQGGGPGKKGRYDLIVIDSLDGCNDSNPYEENRREYALPLKRLARRNGQDFGACSIIVIHHNNRNGGFRGTSAIKAAVDETWNMQKVSNKELAEMAAPFNSRIVTVEKSRDDREGQKMLFSLLPDYTYTIGPVPDGKNTVKDSTPNQHMLDILKLMREERVPWSADLLTEHEHVGGLHKKRAIRYSLSKLLAQKLIAKCDPPESTSFKGRPPAFYIALGTNLKTFRKEPVSLTPDNKCVLTQTPSTGTDLIDKDELSKVHFVKSPGADSLEANTFDKSSFDKTPFVNKNASPGTEDSFDAPKHRHRDFAKDFLEAE